MIILLIQSLTHFLLLFYLLVFMCQWYDSPLGWWDGCGSALWEDSWREWWIRCKRSHTCRVLGGRSVGSAPTSHGSRNARSRYLLGPQCLKLQQKGQKENMQIWPIALLVIACSTQMRYEQFHKPNIKLLDLALECVLQTFFILQRYVRNYEHILI